MKKSRLVLVLIVVLACTSRVTAGVITSLVETGGDGAPTAKFTGETFSGALGNNSTYTVPPFGLLAKSFTDRLHAWTNASGTVLMPPYLLGQEYIMIRNDNRDNNGGTNGGSAGIYNLAINVSSGVRVYLLIDNRLGDNNGDNPPTFTHTNMPWLTNEGWAPVVTGVNRINPNFPDEIGIDEAADGTINQRSSIYVKTFPAGTVTVKTPNNPGRNMYGVVVVPAAPPAAPTGLAAVSGNMEVTLSWNASGGATGYNIRRSVTSGGPYTDLGTTAATTFNDTGLANGVDYFYVVTATNAVGESANSLEVVGHPNPIVTGVLAVGGTNQVQLSWDALAGAESYSVFRASAANEPFTHIASGIGGTSYLDAGATAGQTHYYRVAASLSGGEPSGISAVVSAVTAPSAPNATASLFAATVIRVGWTTPDSVSSQFFVEQSADGVNFTPLATEPATSRGHTNAGLSPSTTYFYRVQAQNVTGFSGYSAVVSNTTPAFGLNVNMANATNGTPANNPAPTPPGYVQDVGELFGDRGNGLFYGWTNAGNTNINVDGRWRQNANSPDLRYDTFNHMQKSPGGATWEIQIPNGFYRVRVVAGDPTAVDSTFQHNIEGVITPTFVPVTGAWWADRTVEVGVSDGMLTIVSGPGAVNNKLNFVDVYPAVPVAPLVTAQPTNTVVEQNRPVSLVAGVSGSAVLQYQWYFNDTAVPNGTNSTLSFARPQPADSGSYYLIVTNYGGAVTSDVAVLTVNADGEPPVISSVASLDGFTIGICFSEEVDVTSGAAQEPSNYQVDSGNITVLSVTYRPDGRSARLTLQQQITGPTSIDILDIPDHAGNATVSITNVTPLGFTALNVGTPGQLGSHYTCDGDAVELVGGGADIWGAGDQGYLAMKPISGNFDARIRVNELRGANAITKAVLVARETIESGSAAVHVSANPPPPGRNQVEMGLRPAFSNATVAVGSSFIPAGVPNAWMRIVRLGNTFTGYRSTNGTDWIQLGQTNIALAAELQVGFGITAHDNALLATGTISGFSISQSFPDLAINKGSDETVLVNSNFDYTISVMNQGAASASGVVVTDVLPAGLSYVSTSSSQGSCTFTGGTITCNLGAIAASGAATVTITVNSTNVGFVTNSATVVSTVDADPSNNSASVVTTVEAVSSQQRIVNFGYSTSGGFSAAIQTQNGITYALQYKDNLNTGTIWQTLSTFTGDGTVKVFSDPATGLPMRYYQIITQ